MTTPIGLQGSENSLDTRKHPEGAPGASVFQIALFPDSGTSRPLGGRMLSQPP